MCDYVLEHIEFFHGVGFTLFFLIFIYPIGSLVFYVISGIIEAILDVLTAPLSPGSKRIQAILRVYQLCYIRIAQNIKYSWLK